ncbi:MAG: hypothetical protein WAM85_08090 [Terracidiphilus sp.]
MKGTAILVCALAMWATAGLAPTSRPSTATDKASITGIWRADLDGLPYVTLNITNETGSLSGAVLFYLHRHDKGEPVTATPGVPEPLFNLTFDGRTLTFQVSHRRAHPPGSLNDSPVSFRFTLNGLGKGELVNENEGSSGLVFVRADY